MVEPASEVVTDVRLRGGRLAAVVLPCVPPRGGTELKGLSSSDLDRVRAEIGPIRASWSIAVEMDADLFNIVPFVLADEQAIAELVEELFVALPRSKPGMFALGGDPVINMDLGSTAIEWLLSEEASRVKSNGMWLVRRPGTGEMHGQFVSRARPRGRVGDGGACGGGVPWRGRVWLRRHRRRRALQAVAHSRRPKVAFGPTRRSLLCRCSVRLT